MPKLLAIRSLQCPDHAYNIPPTVLTLLWFVGKRCNYDCSYCSPHIHDAVSPFMLLDDAINFVDQAHHHCSQQGKTIKWAFTGGEPFLDPGFMPLLRHVRAQGSTDQINVITNGSLPVGVYQEAASIVDGITVSLHLERPEKDIAEAIDKCRVIKDCFVNVNLMCVPGRLQQIKEIQSDLEKNGIKHVLRKITPMAYQEDLLPFEIKGRGRKDQQLRTLEQQSKNKIQWKKNADSLRAANIARYYHQDELDYIAAANDEQQWQNCGIWLDDGSYKEINSDYLVANDLCSFRDWICYAGVDSLYVDFDGQIYRGMCQNAGALGHISQNFTFASTATRCTLDWCTCNNDICVRKAQLNKLDLILGS